MCTLHALRDVKVLCTLHECPATASLHSATPKRKNVSCFFVFSRGWIFSKMERTFFFLVFCPEVSGQVAGRREFRHSSLLSEFRPSPPSLSPFLFCLRGISFFGMGEGVRAGFSLKGETDGIQCRDGEFIAFSSVLW